ncbi:glutamate--cysteine ligase [uncultured Xylophilus sp.]|uniref:glutamate--cysteine ligase n=1 Tax=uncultured Xylophilus sp. TaxID=296832 RepID=UPI0025F4F61D|nr:glutamate--cysteine ligase [uncultured Xylophilus sp.]
MRVDFQHLDRLSHTQLRGMRRGIEKESLRAQLDGALALTPHPAVLGAALTHPSITTDFSESQVELITGAHQQVEASLHELASIHRFVYGALAERSDEMLWVSSMPCVLPADETIPIGRYGSSNVGRAKSVYRMGLGHRYGRRMQTISGIHYNWSMPGLSSEDYFGLIRNFRRRAFLLLYLFGASPAVCSTFVGGRAHALQAIGRDSMHLPHATSLRMGRLGYQSDAQASLAVSYNDLEGYAASLQEALTKPYPAYSDLGILNPGGEYNQLATSLLQIENEFYGTIRPKRTTLPGERPLNALRDRGVEYIEVRCMDLDPFEPVGINAQTMRFLDVFLTQCLVDDSPPDSPSEIAEMAFNQHAAAERGREPGLQLQRQGRTVTLVDWAEELLANCRRTADVLDQVHVGTAHAEAVEAAQAALRRPETLPSARVLAEMAASHGDSFVGFGRARSQETREHFLRQPLDAEETARFTAASEASIEAQRHIESQDTVPFEIYRELYVAPLTFTTARKKEEGAATA